MTTRREFLKTSAAAAVAGGLLPYAARAPAAVKDGGTLTVALFADPRTLDPHLTGNLQGRATTQAIHDTLLEVDGNGHLVPGLVESWEWKDDRTVVLTTRSGVKFHDGTDFDAEAVRYNLERIRNPDTGSIRGGEISVLDTIEVVDAKTVKLSLKQPFAAFLFPLVDVAGCVASPTALERWGQEYGLHPAGTGPFAATEYLKDAHTILERNGDYWNAGKPHLDRLVLRPIPVDSTRLAELRSGGVQLAESLPLQDIPRLREGDEIVVSEKVGFRWEWFGFNVREEYAGRSRKLRQAFQWAIDREALHHVAYFGTGSIGYDGILPGSPFHDPDYKPYERDLDKAKRLVEESGLDRPIELLGPHHARSGQAAGHADLPGERGRDWRDGEHRGHRRGRLLGRHAQGHDAARAGGVVGVSAGSGPVPLHHAPFDRQAGQAHGLRQPEDGRADGRAALGPGPG